MNRVAGRFFFGLSIVGAALCARSAPAQQTLPHLPWRTVDTRYFRFFYTADAEEWTRDVASRIDGARDAVSALVGSAPTKRVIVIVEDPNNISNGFALPLLDHPVIFLWPTPPGPDSPIGNGAWGDQLSIHEFAHIAHLTRESRNPAVRRLARLLPVKFGPLALRAPRWVTEGYATFVEGRVVRSIGRPNGVWRAAVLRQWAIEGQLPTYAALDGSPRFEGGDMAYLAGSAFLEWLAARSGDSSVVHLWRRMSARQSRSFEEAFTGVYGAPPDELYGRFAAELTHDALDVVEHASGASAGARHALLGAGADTSAKTGEGELVQRLHWGTGAPAISRDDSLLAIVLHAPKQSPHVVIWSLAPSRADTGARGAAARARALDPEDVPAVQSRPRPLRIVAELGARGGMSFAEPRFFPDGEHVLLTGLTARGDGAYRGDLYVWNWKSGAVRRVTLGAGIQHGDVGPRDDEAIADRCIGGECDLVRVNLATGALTVIAKGSRDREYQRPRWSRDGDRITASVQSRGHWHIGNFSACGGGTSSMSFADKSEYAPTWASDTDLVAVTEAGGVPNIERASFAGIGPHRSTDVSGAAIDPEPAANGWVYFLRLHARGWDLARIKLDSSAVRFAARVDSAPRNYPWVTPNVEPGTLDSLPVAPLPASRAYGVGPREQRLLVSASWANEGKSGGLAYAGTDPVGKLTWLLQGQWGDRASWTGASLGAVYRGMRPLFGVDAFALENQPSRQHGFDAPEVLDARYRGASAFTEFNSDKQSKEIDVRGAVSFGTVNPLRLPAMSRGTVQLAVLGALLQTPGDWRFAERLGLNSTSGVTGGQRWDRAIITSTVAATGMGHTIELNGMLGSIGGRGPQFERFALGGLAPALVDSSLLSQRVAMPVLPIAVATGDQIATVRASLPGSIWRPYYWAGSADDRLGSWSQVVGIEGRWHTDGVWVLRVPGVQLLGGVGYSLAGPVRHHAQAYFSVAYRP